MKIKNKILILISVLIISGLFLLGDLSQTFGVTIPKLDLLYLDGSDMKPRGSYNLDMGSGNITTTGSYYGDGSTLTGITASTSLPNLTDVDDALVYTSGFVLKADGSKYTGAQLTAADVGAVALTGNETVAGIKTFSSFPILPSSSPTTNYQAVHKEYVDSFVQGLEVKTACRVATTVAGTLATDYENGDTIDGIVLVTGDRILIKNQADATTNGIYTVNASGAPTRATDYDATAEVQEGTYTYISEGTVNEGFQFVQITKDPVLNTNNLVFTWLNKVTGVAWGGISGTVTDQTDLLTYFNWTRTGTTLSPTNPLDSISLTSTTSSNTGIIFKGADRFIHDYHHPTGGGAVPTGLNTFVGVLAGNFTMGSTATQTYHASYNTGVGYGVLDALTTGYDNAGFGYGALGAVTSGSYNTGMGLNALRDTNTGARNVAVGSSTLQANTDGGNNVAVGDQSLQANTTGYYSIGIGYQSLYSNKTGANGVAIGSESQKYANDTAVAWTNYNTSLGYQSLRGSTTAANNTGNSNTALGYGTMLVNTTGSFNIGVGVSSLGANTIGGYNIAVGPNALVFNTEGNYNNALGHQALYSNTTGSSNIGIGYYSLLSNKTGSGGVAIGNESQRYANDTAVAWTNYNTSVGYQALRGSTTAANNTGNENTAIGYQTLLNNTTGGYNVASGSSALFANTTGNYNIGVGWNALSSNTIGAYNTAIGTAALVSMTDGSHNTAFGNNAGRYLTNGSTANTTSDYSVYLGSQTKASADGAQNEIVIGYNATGAGSNTIVFGNTSMVGAYFLADNYKTYWGAGKDVSTYFDGSDWIFNSENITANDEIHFVGFDVYNFDNDAIVGNGADVLTVKDILTLDGITSDPVVTPSDGSIWYRSDTDEFRVMVDDTMYSLQLNPF